MKDAWDKLESASTILAALLIPVVLVIIGNWYTSARSSSARVAVVGHTQRPGESAAAND